MRFQIIEPSAILAPFVKHYWAMDNCMHPSEKHIQRIVPNGFTEMTFYFGDSPEYLRDKKTIKSGNIVSGQQDGFYDIVVTGNLNMLSIVFQPYGTKVFFDLPIDEIYNQSIPAEFLFKNKFNELKNLLEDTPELKGKIELIEKFLFAQLINKKEYELNRMSDSIGFINKSKGIVSIEDLASRACLSEKQYKRTFKEFVGIAPKKFLRIVRFQNTLHIQQTKAIKSLTTLSYESGYYDQSHMINDFKALTGLTPKKYFDDCEPYSDYFSK